MFTDIFLSSDFSLPCLEFPKCTVEAQNSMHEYFASATYVRIFSMTITSRAYIAREFALLCAKKKVRIAAEETRCNCTCLLSHSVPWRKIIGTLRLSGRWAHSGTRKRMTQSRSRARNRLKTNIDECHTPRASGQQYTSKAKKSISLHVHSGARRPSGYLDACTINWSDSAARYRARSQAATTTTTFGDPFYQMDAAKGLSSYEL